jgi:CheY-like chemotaxis protein
MRPTAGRVLVADDDALVRHVLSTVLDHGDFEVVEVADGSSALAQVLADPPIAVVLDHWMPGMTGLEVLAALRASPATAALPVVVLTGDHDQVVAAVAAGADAVLTKPFSPLHLLDVLADLVAPPADVTTRVSA